MKLSPPVIDVQINQPFGVNYVDFYKKLGLKGHNGIDFKTKTGCPVRASHDGKVTFSGMDEGGGVSVTLQGDRFKTIYYHLSETICKKGDEVKNGCIIGLAGNTGKYTTGPHLHFGLKETGSRGGTINHNNGYRGAIDPAPYFPKNWDKTPAWHRYGRAGSYLAEIKIRFKNPWLHRYLIKRNMLYKIYDNEFINGITYGGWGIDEVLNDAMANLWRYRKKYNDKHNNIFKQ